MLDRIHVENYKCLRDVTVELGDFTVLIGPNDSGKSSFFQVLQTFGKLAEKDQSGTFAGDQSLANLVWHKDASKQVVFDVSGTVSDQHHFRYSLRLSVDGRSHESFEWNGEKEFWTEEASPNAGHQQHAPGTLLTATKIGRGKQTIPRQPGQLYLRSLVAQRRPDAAAIQQALTSSVEYHFDPAKLSKPAVVKSGAVLAPTGENLAAVLDVMQNSADRPAFEALQEALHNAIPTVAGIVLPPAAKSGAKALEFILSSSAQPRVTIPGSLASSGALLLTAFLTLAYARTPQLLLIEEPENGLHPTRLQMVVDILRKMSRGDVGNRKRQIILATHNPLLLNYVHPEEVRVFVRHPDEGTKVVPMTEVPDIDRLLKEFSLGELWYLLGEQKLFEEQSA